MSQIQKLFDLLFLQFLKVFNKEIQKSKIFILFHLYLNLSFIVMYWISLLKIVKNCKNKLKIINNR